jgi:hypothetical protein
MHRPTTSSPPFLFPLPSCTCTCNGVLSGGQAVQQVRDKHQGCIETARQGQLLQRRQKAFAAGIDPARGHSALQRQDFAVPL